ncbi:MULTISPECIES: sodium-dependent transporter [unclassified Lentimonas]|uniref:sodium-dependent transporter n=1 Tax=unclassified Lentimonas TaxID=2630993 RepID=UPI001320BA7F|nr:MULTISPECIES: sodium-dependent transporter [unclassified Lentimonas]CAA6676793.1 sodium-dependent transporter [Lentimonas sp. CC4]CAA6687377.1 sodium-dependent transporter [Lentimonas sp. CC6]CAA7075823.1 sodium-dependent transporter [Lentimonas sp. CC4]CAA7171007.1 sodium-dependent transporter [Lentimonas sp. CC21]CAA7183230.1 sodium-dependent transporter [Lentimonas sp. CC8]
MVKKIKESWSSRLGVILAVAGSAVGLGNFLRFPGQAAEYGGGAFMLAYFISFIIIGLPICWAEWTMGRMGGQGGFNSTPGIFNYITRNPAFKYIGIIGVLIPVIIYMYYVYIEAWCLGYAVNFLVSDMSFSAVSESSDFWGGFIGVQENGSALGFGLKQVGFYLILVFILNFILIYRGLSKGIELFCKFAMPTLAIIAVIILVRVLTLGTPNPELPHRNVSNGLGFMWNPVKNVVEIKDESGNWVKDHEIVDQEKLNAALATAQKTGTTRVTRITVTQQLMNPQLWLAAAGQIFFSLSVGFGVIITYSSYLTKKDDVILSGLAAASANEFFEVGLGGLITLPAAVTFLGVAGVAGMGTFGLGFNVLPMVFANMPLGGLFGALFFFLLFLAAVTSSLSMLQPGISFLEEALKINRKQSVVLLGMITVVGCGFVVYFSEGVKALDTMDFWIGTFLIFALSTVQIIIFGWILGIEKGFELAHQGSAIRIPSAFKFIMKYVSPLFLIVIFAMWIATNVFGLNFQTGETEYSAYVRDLFIEPNTVAWLTICLIGSVAALFGFIAFLNPDYKKLTKKD